MIPAGQFTGAPGAGLGGQRQSNGNGLGTVQTLTMPADWGMPFTGSPGAGSIRGLRGLGATPVDGPVYAAVTVAGAVLGGALLGWVAADSKQGAIKAGVFAGGLTSVSSGFGTWSSQKLLGGTMVLGGLAGMLWAIRERIKRR